MRVESEISREAALIREALVREIRDAGRWSAVVEAWEALLAVRRTAAAMEAEREMLSETAAGSGALTVLENAHGTV